MANSILTPTVIANELLMRFKNNLAFAAGCSHEYDERFDKIGDSYKLRVPTRFQANDGADISSAIQDVVEPSVTLQIDTRKNVAFQFSSKELTLDIDRFAERYLDSAAVTLANSFEVAGLTMAYQKTPNVTGTAANALSTAAAFLNAGARLDNNSCPRDNNRSAVLSPNAQASTVDALKGLFQSSTEIGKQYRSGRMGTALGFDFAMSQNIRTHANGAWGTSPTTHASTPYTTTTTNGVASTTLNLAWTGSASGVAKKGDKFVIADCYAVNPVSGDTLDYLQTFTVTADTTASSSAIAALPIYPAIVTSGATKTVSAAALTSKPITLQGAASGNFAQNLVYHKHAFCYATVPLEMPKDVHFGSRATDKDSGISIRMVSQYNILTDVFVTRCDIAFGWAARRPEWAGVVYGS